jgi:sugar phosphate isomerase/epimerase
MKAEQLAIHSLSTSHRNLEEALHAYAAAGFRNVEPYLPLVKAWIEDGHTVEQTQGLFDYHGLGVVASSELAVECFHASDVLLSNLRANSENARLIAELGGRAMIVHTDGPEQVTADSLELEEEVEVPPDTASAEDASPREEPPPGEERPGRRGETPTSPPIPQEEPPAGEEHPGRG